MQTETRFQDDPGLASRYLAGQLSPPELQEYEQHLLENPDAARDLEVTARIKTGLANLRDSGQLASLLQGPPATRWRRPMLKLAASAAFIFIAVGLWRGIGTPQDATLVATASKLMDRSGRPLASGRSYPLVRTRSLRYDAVIELPPEPRAIEFHVRPEAVAPVYSVALSQIRADGSVIQIGDVSELEAQSDGFVRLYVDSSRLEAGSYLLVVTPAEDRGAASTGAFRVKVTPLQER